MTTRAITVGVIGAAFSYLLLILATTFRIWLPLAGNGPRVYYVSPAGSDANSGATAGAALLTIQVALDRAQPGEQIRLAPGVYRQDIVSRRNGTPQAPITISGPATAVVYGGGRGRVIELNHDYITLEGFTVDGRWGNADKAESYRDKLLYAIGTRPQDGVVGLRVLHMTFANAGGECLRLRYFARHNEIGHSSFTGCGVYDFRFADGGKNGEAIYIGTAREQLDDGRSPTAEIDQSSYNWIHHNRFDTRGNECVDIKEGSEGNIVEYNSCTGQKDPDSGGMDARGSANVFRHNRIYGNAGAGVRLGGDRATDGINNAVYHNTIFENQGGGIKIVRAQQGRICGNQIYANGAAPSVGRQQAEDPTAPCPEP